MHNGRHYAGHTQQGKVLFGQIHRKRQVVGCMRKYKSGDTSHIQTGSKDSPGTSSPVGCTGGKNFKQKNQGEEDDDTPIGIRQSGKQGIIHHR